MDRGALWAVVHGVTKSQIQLNMHDRGKRVLIKIKERILEAAKEKFLIRKENVIRLQLDFSAETLQSGDGKIIYSECRKGIRSNQEYFTQKMCTSEKKEKERLSQTNKSWGSSSPLVLLHKKRWKSSSSYSEWTLITNMKMENPLVKVSIQLNSKTAILSMKMQLD